MAKFMLECPHCGSLNQASNFIFAKKVIQCGTCHKEINVKDNRIASRKCPHCGNVYVYDQAKGGHTCPACHKSIAAGDGKIAAFPCPECGCTIHIDENQKDTVCPVCDYQVTDVPKEIAKTKLVTDNGISVIKYEGDNQTFIWKHPIEDFNLGSQLIVHESQEAVFFLNGQALDLFGPGRHTLETQNLPALKKIFDLPTDGQNPFHAEVYFINKTVQMAIKWGTDSRVRFLDPEIGIPLDIGASGEMNLMVSDSRKLLVKLVGTMGGIAWSDESRNFTQSIRESFRPLISTSVKTNLAAAIKEQHIDILEIDEKLEILSECLGKKISAGFEEYGLTIPQFFVTNVAMPNDNDANFKKFREIHGAVAMELRQREIQIEQQRTLNELARQKAERELIEAQTKAQAEKMQGFAEAEVMRAKGYDHKDEIEAEVQKAYAEGIGNFGANGGGGGGAASDVVGLGIGLAAMGVMGDKLGGTLQNMTGAATPEAAKGDAGWTCSCGANGNTGKFCSECGKQKVEPWDCPACGAKGNTGKFCAECGKQKAEPWICPACGAKGNTGKFCAECGKPLAAADTWDCECGESGITSKFCPECGKKREEN